MLVLPRVTEAAVQSVRCLVEEMAESRPWMLLGLDGSEVVEGMPGLKASLRASHRRHSPLIAAPTVSAPHDVFSDLGQWLAKVMLGREIDERWLAGPRGAFRRGAHLATAARVSAPTVSRWLREMTSLGYLERGRDGLAIVRRRECFAAWVRAANATPARSVSARFLLPRRDLFEQLCDALSEAEGQVESVRPQPASTLADQSGRAAPRAVLATFAACRSLDVSFVVGAPLQIYLDPIDADSLAGLGLEIVDESDAHVRVTLPRAPESVFRGRLLAALPNGALVPTCDLLQAWLDVQAHPTRGLEQARALEEGPLSELFSTR